MRVTLKLKGDSVDYAAAAVPASPGYFSALRMRLVKGRFFTDTDDSNHPQVMIMAEDTARRFFGDSDVIGRTMSLPLLRDGQNTSVDITLVGVIANVKYAGLTASPEDTVYRPFAQQPWWHPFSERAQQAIPRGSYQRFDARSLQSIPALSFHRRRPLIRY
jgi:MacB-like protein